MAKVNAKATANKVTEVASKVETVSAPEAKPMQFAGLKYIASANGSLFGNVATIAAKLAETSADQATVLRVACAFYGINAIAWSQKHQNKTGKGCLTQARVLSAKEATQDQLYKAILTQCSSAPKGDKYSSALQAILGLGETGKLQNASEAALAMCAIAWAWGYLANKQANGNKGNVASALAILG